MLGKFFVVGGISTIADYSCYALMVTLGFGYIFAIIVGYSIGLIVNFFLVRKYVFQSGSKFNNAYREFFVIFVVALIGVTTNIVIVWSMVHIDLDHYSARAIAIIIVFFMNYYLRKWFIYFN